MLHGAVASINPPTGRSWAVGDVLVPLVLPAMFPVMRVAGTGFPARSPSVIKVRHSHNLHAAGDSTWPLLLRGRRLNSDLEGDSMKRTYRRKAH